ncbi:alpha/beta hydrolase [Leucobacter rhizosphaerae]|uniref:Alpha/beta hydrolase n=1 Tax=Leucobacter rhizosphaerae TaxID=2932245 RepID=A0ABY4FY99_9MICO|nr:alpha/beta fold hydrolase [Leucobacter rhizosphaerae]UOQ61255.1 alpha/beta hydrolase [Leucobacter rhizosphaerae]
MPLSVQYHRAPAPARTAPPIVLLHGFGSSADEEFLSTGWGASLAAAGRDIIAIDLPGHGRSPAIETAEDARTSAVVRAILEAVDRVIPEHARAGTTDGMGDGTADDTTQFDVIAYSLGARLAWELPAASARVRRLVLGGLSPVEPFGAIDLDHLAAVLDGATPHTPLVGMMAGMISAPGRDTDSLARLIGGLAAEPFRPTEGGPSIPTLFVAGLGDGMTTGVEDLAAAMPRGSVTRVPGDHRGALDSVEFRIAAIEFLAD